MRPYGDTPRPNGAIYGRHLPLIFLVVFLPQSPPLPAQQRARALPRHSNPSFLSEQLTQKLPFRATNGDACGGGY